MSINNVFRRRIMLLLITFAIVVSIFPTSNRVHAIEANLALNANGAQEIEGDYPKATASHIGGDSVWKAIDGEFFFDDPSHSRWTSYASNNATDWFAIEFAGTTTFNQIKLYVYNDGGGVQPPTAYIVQYWDDTDCDSESNSECHWINTTNQTNDPLEASINVEVNDPEDTLNTVDFDTVTSNKIRVVLTNGTFLYNGNLEDFYSGLVELEVYNVLPPLESFYSAFSNEGGDVITLYVSNVLDAVYTPVKENFQLYNGTDRSLIVDSVTQNAENSSFTLQLSESLPDDTSPFHLKLLGHAFQTNDNQVNISVDDIPITQPSQLDLNNDNAFEIGDLVMFLLDTSINDINNDGAFDDKDIKILFQQIKPMFDSN